MSTEPSQQKDDFSKAQAQWYDRGWFHVFVFIALMVGVYLVWDRSDSWLYSSPQDRESRAQIGDSYGQLNTLFSGLALAALVFTLLLQQRALVLQRKEFQNQLTEMAGSREELREQNRLQKINIRLKGLDIKSEYHRKRIVTDEIRGTKVRDIFHESEYNSSIELSLRIIEEEIAPFEFERKSQITPPVFSDIFISKEDKSQ